MGDMARKDAVLDHLCGALEHADALIRCAAARCLTAFADPRAAEALAARLLDEDPDVRSDAMEALAVSALPGQTKVLLKSLAGDPVTEVKTAAIRALARLGDARALPLIRDLARDRSEETVAWEDEAGVWDDWLPVQTAAIAALGEIGNSDCIPDLLQIRSDEFGQDLDTPVFRTLAKLGEAGASTLLTFVRDPDAKVRARALAALEQSNPLVLRSLQELLLRDSAAEVRKLALRVLPADSDAIAELMLQDRDAEIRRSTLARFGTARPEIARKALRDPDESVRAALLKLAAEGQVPLDELDLKENLLAWMSGAGAALAGVAAQSLAALFPGEAAAPLFALAGTAERPLEARLAALQSLAKTALVMTEEEVEQLGELARDPMQQIRVAALVALLARSGASKAAEGLLVQAIEGSLGADLQPREPEALSADDAATPKEDEGSARGIEITPEGEIVTRREAAAALFRGRASRSTLDSIQQESQQPAPEAKPLDRKKRRRVAVDGPDDIAQDLRRQAIALAGASSNAAVAGAIDVALSAADAGLKRAAFKAVSGRGELPSQALLEQAEAALGESDPLLRGYAASILARGAREEVLLPLLSDPDPLIRAEALPALAVKDRALAWAALEDPTAPVRRAAGELLLAQGTSEDLKACLRRLADRGYGNSLSDICRRDVAARGLLAELLLETNCPRQRRLQLMDCLSAMVGVETPEGPGSDLPLRSVA